MSKKLPTDEIRLKLDLDRSTQNSVSSKGTFFSQEECKLILTALENEWLPNREKYAEWKSVIAKLRDGCE